MSYCKAINCYKERNSCYYTDYCSYHRECLNKLFGKNDNFNYDNVWEIETFETYFNGNCGYVITYNWYSPAFCSLWIVVYEPAVRNMEENLVAIKYKRNFFCSKSEAKNKAGELKSKLQSNGLHDTPMLETDYEKFKEIITEPYVKGYLVSSSCFLSDDYSDFDGRIKPLDIITVGKKHDIWRVDYDHVGVYLGNNKVCHFYDWHSPIKNMKVRVDSIGTFLGHTENTSRCGVIYAYHPIIPFKNYSKIVRQIAWAEKEDFWKGRYDLANRNCEHLANMLVYGINYSKQVEDNEGKLVARNAGHWVAGGVFSLLWHDPSINNGKSTLKLFNEMSESNGKFGYTDAYHWRTNEIERQYLQEVPPKQECRIM